MTFDFTRLQNRFRPHAVLALAFTGDSLAAYLVRESAPDAPERFRMPLSEASLQETPEQAGAELAAALAQAKLHESRCVVCLPLSWALSTSADLPEVAPEDLRSYFDLRAEREFSTTDLRLAHNSWTLPNGQLRATLAALPAKRVEALEQCLTAAGLRLVSLSLGLDGCFSAAAPTLHLLSRAANRIDAVISAGGGIALLRPLGGGSGPADPASLARELRITLGRLPEPLRTHVRHARLMGPPSPELRATLEQIGLETITETPDDPGNAAVAAARQYLHRKPIPFEFLLPEPARWPAHLQRFNTVHGRRIAAAAAAIVLLPLAAFLWRSHTEASLTAEWNGMKNSVAELDTLQQKIRQFRPWFEPAPQKLQALRTLIAAFPERGDVWTRSIQLSYEKPDPGSHTPASLDVVTANVSGFSRNNAALLSLQDNLRKQSGISAVQLKQVRGNNPLQFSITFKWQPKHD